MEFMLQLIIIGGGLLILTVTKMRDNKKTHEFYQKEIDKAMARGDSARAADLMNRQMRHR